MRIQKKLKRIINSKKVAGFTLIELIMVIALMAILSTAGFSAFIKYREQQAFNTAVSDVVNTLYSLRSRSQSKVAFNRGDTLACDPLNARDANSFVLKGWKLAPCRIDNKLADGTPGNPASNGCPVFQSSSDYMLIASCLNQDGSDQGTDFKSMIQKKFPSPDITFVTPSTNWIGFNVSGGIDRGNWGPGNKLTIQGYGFQRTITVNDDQSITVKNP